MKKRNIIIGLIVIIIIIVVTVFLFNTFGGKISKSEALDIAYEHIGLKEKEIIYQKIEPDYKDNCYELEFNDGIYKYELEIDMKTGKVIEYEKESVSKLPSNNDSNSNNSDIVNSADNGNENNNDKQGNEEFTVDQAKEIVLKHAGLKINDVVFTEVKQEYEKGKLVYEIEFIYNGYEYDYEIDVTTKTIVKYEKERK